ncbi:MAG: Ig-like domain-containing protein [Limisphaerales bacterium]
MILAIFAAIVLANVSSHAQTLWTGPNIIYTHTSADAQNPTNPASVDQITPGVWITRATGEGLFNAVTQSSYGNSGSPGSGTPDGSPSDTEWAIGSIDNYGNLSYGSWYAVLHGGQGVDQQAVLHLISENIYISIEFTSFISDGTYTYVRSTPAVAVTPTVTITNPMSGTVFPAPATVPIGATATATGGTVTNVSFFTNNVFAGASTVAPYGLTLSGVQVGSYAITAVAGADGMSATSAVVNISVVTPVSVTLTSPTVLPGAGFKFSYSANVGLAYVIQRATNLNAPAWISLATNVAAGNPTNFVDSRVTSNPAYYRVGRLPNP